MKKATRRGGRIPRITDARTAHTDEMHTRMVKYTVSMSIRLVCLFLLFFVHGWLMWVVIAGAVVLPWIAVVIANGGSDTNNMTGSDSVYTDAPRQQLESGPPQARDSAETAVLHGEIIDDDGQDGRGKAEPDA